MGLLDNVFGSGSSSAVPGGNVTKPLMIALLALLASRYMSGGSKEAPASARPDAPTLPELDARSLTRHHPRRLGGLTQTVPAKGSRRSGRFLDQNRAEQGCRPRSDFGCTWSRRYRHPFPAHGPLQGSGLANSVPSPSQRGRPVHATRAAAVATGAGAADWLRQKRRLQIRFDRIKSGGVTKCRCWVGFYWG